MTSDRWYGAGFLVVGSVVAVMGVRQLWVIAQRRRNWMRYHGEVVDYTWRRNVSHSDMSNSDIQYWILQWVDEGGQVRTARNPTGSSGGTLRQFPFPVDILVDPRDPDSAQVARGGNSGVTAGVLQVVVGIAFAAFGILLLTVA